MYVNINMANGNTKEGDENRGSTKDSLETQVKKIDNSKRDEAGSSNKEVKNETNKQSDDSDNKDTLINVCKNCRKAFKTLNSYTKHVKGQTCVDLLLRTYCVLCDKTYKSRDEYIVHMMSGDHMAQINKSSFKNIIDLGESKQKKSQDNINRQNIVDPYLSTKESLSMVDSDNKFTIVYKDGRTEDKVMRVDKKKDKKGVNVGIDESKNTEHEPRVDALSPISNVSSTEDNVEQRYEKEVVSREDDEAARKKKEEEGALRRKKIMVLLGKIQNEEKAVSKFLKILNKLNLEDYKGLNTEIIKDKNIKVLPKQKYLQAIKDFIGLLVKKKNEGFNAHNGNDIQQIVTNLTC